MDLIDHFEERSVLLESGCLWFFWSVICWKFVSGSDVLFISSLIVFLFLITS